MARILVPVDGSANSGRAVSYAMRLARTDPSAEMHLLNVQPAIASGEVRRLIGEYIIEKYQRSEGERALEPARQLLEGVAIAYKTHVAVGPAAESIARYAQELNCDAIVMGTRGLGTIAGMVLGSVATKVLHLVVIPVTLVR
jgi:nucleotide-binding universal stress UspA family protein